MHDNKKVYISEDGKIGREAEDGLPEHLCHWSHMNYSYYLPTGVCIWKPANKK